MRADGFYRVTKAELQAVGFPVNSDPTTWQLFCDGIEQAIIVAPNGDYIEFVGKAHETPESDLRFYFLSSGAATGKRMDSVVSRTVGSTVMSPNYQQTFFVKQRTNYVNDILNGDAENYWGAIVTTTPVSYTFNLSGIDTNLASASVTIRMQGFSTTAHSVTLSINGQSVPAATGNGTNPFSTSVTLPLSVLHEGSNTLQMASSTGSDYSLFDSISVTYNRKFQAIQNQLPFYTLNYRGARIIGFSSPNVRVFDTTRDGAPVQLTNLKIVQNGAAFDVVLPPYRGRILYGVEDSAVKSVAAVVADNPSNLDTAAHSADLVIIAYGDYMTQAQTWAQYRQQQGFSVEVVDVADIFDEFNFGQSSSASINAFLQYAVNNWQTPPQYVLLLGDASFDPKNYEGQGYQNLIPTKIVNTVYSETGSDDALADFNDDGLADISIGRIPAQSGQVIPLHGRGVQHHAAAVVARAVLGRLPGTHVAALALHAQGRAGLLLDPHGEQPGAATGEVVAALEAAEVAAGVEADALGLPAHGGIGPGRVAQLEQDPQRAVGEHPRGAEVLGHHQPPVAPQPAAAAAPAGPGRVEVGPLAVVAVVVVGHVPVVDHQPARALEPDVDGAAGERLARPGLETLAVDAVGHPVVLPGEVVVALAHEAAVGPEVPGPARGRLAQRQREDALPARGQVGQEDQQVGELVAVVVQRLGGQLASLGVGHVDTAQLLPSRQGAQRRGRQLDRLAWPGQIQRVADHRLQARRAGGLGRLEEKEGCERHETGHGALRRWRVDGRHDHAPVVPKCMTTSSSKSRQIRPRCHLEAKMCSNVPSLTRIG